MGKNQLHILLNSKFKELSLFHIFPRFKNFSFSEMIIWISLETSLFEFVKHNNIDANIISNDAMKTLRE
jgi:hypothetical protein